MTDVLITSKDCNCEPGDPGNNFVLVEGQTTVWVCCHTKGFKATHQKVWEPLP